MHQPHPTGRTSRIVRASILCGCLAACASPGPGTGAGAAIVSVVSSSTVANVWTATPVLGVNDVRATYDYFCNVLGFSGRTFIEGVVSGEGGVYAIVEREGAAVHLQIRRRELFSKPRERIEVDLYLQVADARPLFEDYRAKDVKIVRPLESSDYGLRDFIVELPEGQRINFGSTISE